MDIQIAKEKFEALLLEQLSRVEKMKEASFVDFKALKEITIGIVHGDGIGPSITSAAGRVLEHLLAAEVQKGKVHFKTIDGLTIENRLAAKCAIPQEVLEELKNCDVLLKGPTTTPQAGDGVPNIESANVAMRKSLDLFANVRPVRIPEQNIDWTFFRENTEGAYAVGSKGLMLDGLGVDFTITTRAGSERIIRAAFEYAKNNGKTRVTAVTKANVIKTTDGLFLEVFKEIAKEYPGIETDEWYIDIMTAKLIDEKRRTQFQVMVLPNLYGDILTDEAAELQGGVGTAGSANLGTKYAMFEAIHGSAPRMVQEGRHIYADPSSIMRAAVMLLSHIGYTEEAERLSKALDNLTLTITGRSDGCTTQDIAEFIIKQL